MREIEVCMIRDAKKSISRLATRLFSGYPVYLWLKGNLMLVVRAGECGQRSGIIRKSEQYLTCELVSVDKDGIQELLAEGNFRLNSTLGHVLSKFFAKIGRA